MGIFSSLTITVQYIGVIMSLTDLWEKSKAELQSKNVQQIISFAGDVSTDLIQRYADQCLQSSFNGSGFVLQDIVNQIGHRLGFKVEYGRYRGVSNQIGYDGLWELPKI
jgi:hypothetical protein